MGGIVLDTYYLDETLEKSTIRLAKMVEDYSKAKKLSKSGALDALYGDDNV